MESEEGINYIVINAQYWTENHLVILYLQLWM